MSFWTPTTLNQTIGNAGSMELLRAVLGNRDRAPQAYCFEGPHGMGKSSIAKLFLNQLLPEAKVVVIQPERFGQMLQQEDLTEYACLVWDHANRLTKEQADQLCAHLDRSDVTTVNVFLSTEYSKLHAGIRARTLRIPCTKPPQADLAGLLGSICASHSLNFEVEALEMIATRSQGVPAQAIQSLQATSLLGSISVATVNKLQPGIDEQASLLLQRIVSNQSPMELVTELKDTYPVEEMIDAMFTAYSTAVYDKTKSFIGITEKLSNYKKVGDIFAKWKSIMSPPPATLYLLTKELMESNAPEFQPTESLEVPTVQRSRQITPAELDELLSEGSATGDSTVR